MCLHFKRGIKLFIAMFTLCKVTKVKVMLFSTVNMTLNVHHCLHIVVQHLRTIPTLMWEEKMQKTYYILYTHTVTGNGETQEYFSLCFYMSDL